MDNPSTAWRTGIFLLSVTMTFSSMFFFSPRSGMTPVAVCISPSLPFTVCHNRSLHVEHIWNEVNAGSSSCAFREFGLGDERKHLCSMVDTSRYTLVSVPAPDSSCLFEEQLSQRVQSTIVISSSSRNCSSMPNTSYVSGLPSELSNKTVDVLAALSVNLVILSVSYPYLAWDVIEYVLRLPAPTILLIRLHMSLSMDCSDYIKAQVWRQLLQGRYELMNWRRSYHAKHWIETTYMSEKSLQHPQHAHGCMYRYKVMNEGLGGLMSQVMLGMVLAHETRLLFCLSNSLVCPDPTHSSDYSWILKYISIPFCKHFSPLACDVNAQWESHYWWSQTNVITRFNKYFPFEMEKARKLVAHSIFNHHLQYCVHVRTGNLLSIPKVQWSSINISVFGANASDQYAFCSRNNCTFIAKVDVEFDFINLANCQNVVFSDSTFSVMAAVFSPIHYNNLPPARGVTRHFLS